MQWSCTHHSKAPRIMRSGLRKHLDKCQTLVSLHPRVTRSFRTNLCKSTRCEWRWWSASHSASIAVVALPARKKQSASCGTWIAGTSFRRASSQGLECNEPSRSFGRRIRQRHGRLGCPHGTDLGTWQNPSSVEWERVSMVRVRLRSSVVPTFLRDSRLTECHILALSWKKLSSNR